MEAPKFHIFICSKSWVCRSCGRPDRTCSAACRANCVYNDAGWTWSKGGQWEERKGLTRAYEYNGQEGLWSDTRESLRVNWWPARCDPCQGLPCYRPRISWWRSIHLCAEWYLLLKNFHTYLSKQTFSSHSTNAATYAHHRYWTKHGLGPSRSHIEKSVKNGGAMHGNC